MVRKAGLVVVALILALVLGSELSARNAYAAAKRIECDKVMAELAAGKKAKDVATEMKISTSSVYRCKKKAAAAKGAKTAATPAPSAAASPKHM